MSRELNQLELSSAIGGLQFSISSQKSSLMSSMGGGLMEPPAEREPARSDELDEIKL